MVGVLPILLIVGAGIAGLWFLSRQEPVQTQEPSEEEFVETFSEGQQFFALDREGRTWIYTDEGFVNLSPTEF